MLPDLFETLDPLNQLQMKESKEKKIVEHDFRIHLFLGKCAQRWPVCVFVPLVDTRNPIDWRFLAKECITNIAKIINPFLGSDNI